MIILFCLSFGALRLLITHSIFSYGFITEFYNKPHKLCSIPSSCTVKLLSIPITSAFIIQYATESNSIPLNISYSITLSYIQFLSKWCRMPIFSIGLIINVKWVMCYLYSKREHICNHHKHRMLTGGCYGCKFRLPLVTEKYEDTKGVIRSSKSKDRKRSYQMKKVKNGKQPSTKHYTEN